MARRADDWLVFVERGVEYHRHAGQLAKVCNELIVTRVHFTRNGLQPSRTVYMSDRRNFGAALRLNLINHQHGRRRMRLLKVVSDTFFKDGWREGAERLALLDALVKYVLHIGA